MNLEGVHIDYNEAEIIGIFVAIRSILYIDILHNEDNDYLPV